MKPTEMPLLKEMCPTCPFRKNSKTSYLRTQLEQSALTEASRICHSTGKDNAFHADTGKPEALCRGARDVQLVAYHALGVIDAPTDQAWQRKVDELRANGRL